jgi:hypothetical protein
MSELIEVEPALAPEAEPRYHPYWFPDVPEPPRARPEPSVAPIRLAPHAGVAPS